MSLECYFNPSSIAVVGASNDPGKAGYQIFKNLLDLGFEGPVYPVNPNLPALFEKKCYSTINEIDGPVELIIVSVPAFGVPQIFEEAKNRGDVRAAVIIASGFSETKIPERVELEKQVMKIAREGKIRVMGPNCVGVMNTSMHLDTTFAAGIIQTPGGMSVISQSGSLGAALLMFATHQPASVGFAKWAHVGNQADVDVLEVMKYYRDDPDTKAIAIYMEGINNAKEFLEVAREVSEKKPIIALKVGRSEAGSGAAASHTGSLVGSDALYDASFRQTGIIRVDTIEELLDTAKAFSMQPLPAGNRIAVLTEAGGPGIIAMDELGLSPDITMAPLENKTIEALKEALPPMAIVDHTTGYIDMSAAADEDHHAKALEILLEDPNVDGIVHLSVPPTFLLPDVMAEKTAAVLKKSAKPVTICYLAGEWINNARKILEAAGIPTFDMPERAARAMKNMVLRSKLLKQKGEEEKSNLSLSAASQEIITGKKRQGRDLTEPEARAVLADYGIAFPPSVLAASPEEAVSAFQSFGGGPAVLKIVSPDILHKSDIGGVEVNKKTPDEVRKSFDSILSKAKNAFPAANIEGVLVTPMAREGTEIIIGATRDPQFGPVVMIGMGGIFVEVLKDVSFRVAPFTRDEARSMIDDLKLKPILHGVRGVEKADIDGIIDYAVKIGQVMLDNPGILEIDLNPVRVYTNEITPLDARIILKK